MYRIRWRRAALWTEQGSDFSTFHWETAIVGIVGSQTVSRILSVSRKPQYRCDSNKSCQKTAKARPRGSQHSGQGHLPTDLESIREAGCPRRVQQGQERGRQAMHTREGVWAPWARVRLGSTPSTEGKNTNGTRGIAGGKPVDQEWVPPTCFRIQASCTLSCY